MKLLLSAVLLSVGLSSAQAAVILFDLVGAGGTGLLATNERTAAGAAAAIAGTPGSGGELGQGFSYDTVTKVFTLGFSWTNLQGASVGTFGAASGFHIHGPVTAGDPQLFNAGVLHNLIGGTSGGGTTPAYSITNLTNGTGTVTGTISNITLTQENDLLAGKWYVNVHSNLNTSGEIRGNLVQVPEPSITLTLGLSVLGLAGTRRRK